MSRSVFRDPKLMTGDYAKMFDLEQHPANVHFVRNGYQTGKCQCGDMVCFSLTNGALACRPDKARMLVFNTEGDMVSVPIKHQGSHSTRASKSST